MSTPVADRIADAQGMSAMERFIDELRKTHPSKTLIGLWHGGGEGSASYIKAAVDAGFTIHASTTEAELEHNIKNIEKVLFVFSAQDFIPKSTRQIIAIACEKYDPLYFLRIETSFGIDPKTQHRSIITSFCSDVYTDTTASRQVSDRTYELFDKANAEALGINPDSVIDLEALLAATSRKSKLISG